MLTLFHDFDRDFNHRFVDRLFRDFEARPRFDQIGPRVDIVESDEAFELTAEVPGYRPEDVEITFHEGVLTVAGKVETSDEKSDNRGKVIFRERRRGAFSRSFKLGDAVDADKIEATVRDGVLAVTLPKAAETRPRQIAIKTSQ